MMDIDARKTGSIPKFMWHHRYCILAILLFTTVARCQEVTVAAVITPKHIQINERARLDLTMSGKTLIGHIGLPTFNFLPNFLAMPLTTKTIPRFIDEKVTVEMNWSYELIPQKTGKIKLSDVKFSYQHTNYFANPGTIIIGAVDTYRDTSTGGIHKIQAEVSNKKPYIYEPIEYKFRYLYTTILPTLESPIKTLPAINDIMVDESVDELTSSGKVDGFHYDESIRILYPVKEGKIVIPPAELKLPIKGNPKILNTEMITLNVQQLPTIGKPSNFNGAVGDYKITSQIDRSRLEVRDALTMTIKFTGKGNHTTIKPPIIPNIDGIRVDPPVLVQEQIERNPIFTYVIIPLKTGILKIPSIGFTSFNTQSKTYQTTYTTPFPITVVPRPSDVINDEVGNFNWIWVSLMILPIVLVLGYIGIRLYKNNNKIIDNGLDKSHSISPTEVAISKLKSMDTISDENTWASLGESLTRILHQYICDLKGNEFRQLNLTELEEMCAKLGLSDEIVNELLDILSKCKYHKYAPVSISADEQNELLERTENIIKLIEENQ